MERAAAGLGSTTLHISLRLDGLSRCPSRPRSPGEGSGVKDFKQDLRTLVEPSCAETLENPGRGHQERQDHAHLVGLLGNGVEDVNTSGVNTGHVVEGQGYRPVVSERNDGLNQRIAILRSNESTEREGPRLEELDPHAKDYPCG